MSDLGAHPQLQAAKDALARLIGFDTTSHLSNLPLLDWVNDVVTPLGAKVEKLPDKSGQKANMIVRFGPENADGGVILSGHTDVVPVVGQPWDTDPFSLIEKDGRLYGRGTCDMKGFSACLIALAPKMAAAALKKPIYWALSHDEEIGCVGAPPMVDHMAKTLKNIEGVIIGEPSMMKVVSGQKGIATFEVIIIGKEAHSSQIGQGLSAIHEAVPLLTQLLAMADALRAPDQIDKHSLFEPAGTSMTIGVLEGGTAVNILARQCKFRFDIRYEVGFDLSRLVARINALVAACDVRIKQKVPEGGASFTQLTNSPAMGIETGRTSHLKLEKPGQAEGLARQFTGDNRMRAVAYATEGGLFQGAGFSTVICGPGDIAQAHQPNEFVDIDQIDQCLWFLDRLIAHQC